MKTIESFLEQGKDYQLLSIKDLLEARDAYHVFLTRKKNVIGTAIGKYRFYKEEKNKDAKTLENSEVRPYSWPSVLVFVDGWIKYEDFGKNSHTSNDDFIPQYLYLPDGREVPVCVIKAEWGKKPAEPVNNIKFPGSLLGGGYPIITKIQGEERISTLGCLVTNGRLIYGLTNTHVSGRPGENLYTWKNGNEYEIGFASEKQIQKKPFSEVYEGFPGKYTLINMDVSLIELHEIQDTTSQIFGLGELKGLADINHDTLSLKLIGCPLKGFGCVSGEMKGEIVGLFYRYTNIGGYDIITDYLVGQRNIKKDEKPMPFFPKNGDSGTLLVIDDPNSKENMKAIGILWGGQKGTNEDSVQSYGLVTNLGTICRMLDIELEYNWNKGYDNYFGAFAHFTLPSLCTDIIENKKLKELMENNKDKFSMSLESTNVRDTKGLSNASFIPLPDVADLLWKRRGGAFQRGKEGANHFADMDQPIPGNQQTLLELCQDTANINPKTWLEFYNSVNAKEKGALPFRVAQIFDAMVNSKNKEEFVCAAGVLAHYTFDACMPLHISYMHHGDPNGPKKIVHQGGKEKEIPLAYDVHAEFDNQMVEYHVGDLRQKLPQLVKSSADTDKLLQIKDIKTPKGSAIATVQLMSNTFKYAPPQNIVKDFEELVNLKKRERNEKLWEKYGEGMMQAMAEAVVLTARLWEAAWNMSQIQNVDTNAVPEEKLKELYEDKNFLESLNLEEIEANMHQYYN